MAVGQLGAQGLWSRLDGDWAGAGQQSHPGLGQGQWLVRRGPGRGHHLLLDTSPWRGEAAAAPRLSSLGRRRKPRQPKVEGGNTSGWG